MTTVAEVRLWGRSIAAVSVETGTDIAAFEYDREFASSGIEVAPIAMPLSRRIYRFPELPLATFRGLPGLLNDSLPDRFGNTLIDAWLATQGRRGDDFNAVERLCYTGTRGMGALEFAPIIGPPGKTSRKLEVDQLVELASAVLSNRGDLHASFGSEEQGHTLTDILRVGTSAGGARAKAVIAWNPTTYEVRSGKIDSGAGFQHWLLKFDGVSGNKDKEVDDPQGYGAIEFAYANMARACGIAISECRLFEENGRRHFMTRRFDRADDGSKLHMQTLGALAHFDFNAAGAHSYEQALLVLRQLKLPMESVEELFRRMVFNIVARNQDDHVKNIAFLMDKTGDWSLAPAYDMTYSYNPDGLWTGQHQMTLNGKRDDFVRDDFDACAKTASMKRGRAKRIVEEVAEVVTGWRAFANNAGIEPATAKRIQTAHRLQF
jgi:serine/threonine-protein kinase HipA